MSKSDDLAEISAVIARYSTAMDERQWHLMDDVFLEDATVNMNGQMFCNGRAKIVHLIRTAIECCSITHHMNSNIEVTFSGDTARVVNKFRAWHRGKGPREHLVFEALGDYTDDFVRTPHGWRIRHRAERSLIDIGASQEEFFAEAMPVFMEAAKAKG